MESRRSVRPNQKNNQCALKRPWRQSNTAGLSTSWSAPRAKGGDDENDDESDEEMTHEQGVARVSALFGVPLPPATHKQLLTSVKSMDVAEIGDVCEYRIPNLV